MKAHTLLILTLTLLMSAALVSAVGLEPPHQFFGEIYINGEFAPVGTTFTAEVNGNVQGSGIVTTAGQYGTTPNIFYVSEGESDNFDGDVIQFYVDGVQAQSSTFTNGASTELELSVQKAVTTTTGGAGGGGGGGGGGGAAAYQTVSSDAETDEEESSGSSDGPDVEGTEATADVDALADACVPDWVCSEWTACVNGFEKRKCIDANQCGVEDGRPAESATCEEEVGFGEAFVGAFIGEGSRAGGVLGIVLLLAIVGGAVLIARRRK